MKKVTVVIPAYNKAELTVKTVDSVLKQKYENIEIIVVDDGSTDNTRECLEKFSGRIKYIYKENGGACSARNRGIREATGEYIGLLDCDDLYLRDKILLSVKYLEDNNDYGFVHTAAYFMYKDRNDLGVFSSKESRRRGWISDNLIKRNYICNSTVVARRSCFDNVGMFDENTFYAADWDMWIRLSEKYKAGYVNHPLTKHRDPGKYEKSKTEEAKESEMMILNNAFKRRPDLYAGSKKRAISNHHSRFASFYRRKGDIDMAKKELVLSVKEDPTNWKAKIKLFALSSGLMPAGVR